ncbi:hypothetical protein KBZ18_15650 [Synechococcus sp. Cruz-9H2]|uniref:calcium-binding protein n=1 Tax=unclassified Synechococcus TaxID=2626047 RepID=UPI0020CE3619|nr:MULTISPECIES: hypothetical protein [unclassified Synechococcus]MCP9820917.1 hypothetical protein [Synechococcus sp. Cruz-9H2]MCP9845135.1 hypothetical protein [Synechococcus sp. Edmonson 11F2]MCP9857305.1 hypothetical protein [Synechococcus sp. Cruz-9C9]MCP9864568.1 hypothetical protein [Synechococcus sp. Cruz-7E5]MCP9871837.1 hypothetical protein [Synechococcus sp. Cruz-7B9]
MAFSASVLGSSNPDFLTFQTPNLGGTSLLMEGFQGDDTLESSVDLDGASITGGQGNDSIFIDEQNGEQFSVLNSTVKGGDGADSLNIGWFYGFVTDWVSNFTNMNSGNDSIVASTETISDSTFQGGQGDDTIYLFTELAQNGNLIGGNLGNDSIVLVTDNNVDPGIVDTTVNGGQGQDTITTYYEDVSNSIFSGDLGNDSIHLYYTDTSDVTVRGGDGADTINSYYQYDDGNDALFINGNAGNDSIYFYYIDTVDSTVQGGQGDDTVVVGYYDFEDNVVNGNLGNDSIYVYDAYVDGSTFFGGQGQDTIDLYYAYTDDGKATVSGNIGADLLIGGEDADISFFYRYGDTEVNASGAGRDTIEYFDGGDNISVVGGVGSLAILNTTSLNNFITEAAGSLNSGAAFQWYDDLVDSTYVFISDGSGSLNSADVLVQVLDTEKVDAPYVFELDDGKLVLV